MSRTAPTPTRLPRHHDDGDTRQSVDYKELISVDKPNHTCFSLTNKHRKYRTPVNTLQREGDYFYLRQTIQSSASEDKTEHSPPVCFTVTSNAAQERAHADLAILTAPLNLLFYRIVDHQRYVSSVFSVSYVCKLAT